MAAPSLTFTLTNGSTADASQVMQNFNDLLNGVTDGTKDLSIAALTAAGTATLNGDVNLGNSSSDTLTVTASLGSSVVPSTTGTRSLGSGSLGFLDLYLAASADADTARVVAAAHAADRVYTIPDAGADASFVLTQLAQTISGTKTFDGQLIGKGTATNDSAAAGYIGEFISASSAGVTPASSGSYKTIATISLTAGDWDVTGIIQFTIGSATSVTSIGGAISTTTDNTDSIASGGTVFLPYAQTLDSRFTVGTRRISLSGTTSVFLVGRVNYATLGTATWSANSFVQARRVR
jgi:hypothetical protein